MRKTLFALVFLSAPAWALEFNTATVDQLAALKGMTRQKAEAVVAARAQSGPFTSSADLMSRVPGVTQGILNRNRASLTIAGKAVTTRSGTAPAIPGVRSAIPAKKEAGTQTGSPSAAGKGSKGTGSGGASAGGQGGGHGGGQGGGGHK